MERVATDILGPLPETERGNKYILIISDYFSKWTESFAIMNQTAATVADILVKEFFCRFGTSNEIHSDQGSNYESALFSEVCKLLDIRKTRTTPLNPKSDGMVERFNRTLEGMLATLVDKNQRNWDLLLPFVMMAYRASEHASTKATPNMLFLGREVSLPIDLVTGLPPQLLPAEGVYASDLREDMTSAHEMARQELKKSAKRQKKQYDKRANTSAYAPGSFVWVFNPAKKKGISPKLQSLWIGPYLVVERLDDFCLLYTSPSPRD